MPHGQNKTRMLFDGRERKKISFIPETNIIFAKIGVTSSVPTASLGLKKGRVILFISKALSLNQRDKSTFQTMRCVVCLFSR